MGARHTDRLWMVAGLAVVVLLAIGSWFLLIGPKYAEADDVRQQTADTQVQLITLRNRITDLKQQQAKLPKLKATLADRQKALPGDSGVPAFLRQLQASGDEANVDVTGVTVSAPVQQANLPMVWALPIALTAQGKPTDLQTFLTGLQSGQSRAVLIETAGLGPQGATSSADGTGDTATAGKVSINLSLKAFVATPAGAGAPTITTR
jgi:Tfp pilus assembly protein PilO